ncbi:MAG: HAMP domain-containing histidine kinase [Candidatus Magnetominusculus sp. LBB02]|nr:HAMP domain-containing histidine kinase [Candidatus Magnetominusculus sp. LBB02]
MARLTNEELIEELKIRFKENEDALFDLKAMTKKLVQINKKLEDSEAVKGHFLSNIRNEINNPLTSILGLSEQILCAQSLDEDFVRSMMSLIFEEAFHLDFQIRNIFAAAEVESGENSLGASIVDVLNLFKNIISSFRQYAQGKDIEMEMIYDLPAGEDAIFFKTDPEKLSLIVSNLLANAIEFTDNGGKVELRFWTDEGSLRVDVKDNGVGVDNADLNVIFDRFRQIETGSTKTHRGHGLGLSIVKAIVELLGGTISVTSEKGAGSVFSVAVPEYAGDDSATFSSEGNEFIFDDGAELF